MYILVGRGVEDIILPTTESSRDTIFHLEVCLGQQGQGRHPGQKVSAATSLDSSPFPCLPLQLFLPRFPGNLYNRALFCLKSATISLCQLLPRTTKLIKLEDVRRHLLSHVALVSRSRKHQRILPYAKPIGSCYQLKSNPQQQKVLCQIHSAPALSGTSQILT